MRSPARLAAIVLLTAALLPAVAVSAPADPPAVRLLGTATVPLQMPYRGTTVGGLSGIDRDPCGSDYLLISDDRSFLQPARFYTARIRIDATGVQGITFTGTHPFRRPDGGFYSAPTLNDGNAVDPEEARIDPKTCAIWWAQEGNRPKVAGGPEPVVQPSIQFATGLGAYKGALALPGNYAITMAERGPRRNQVLESLAFGARGEIVTSAVEGPLIQDGPEPTVDRGALVRVTQQARNGAILGQYAYPLEKIFAAPTPGSPWAPDTGVAAILSDPDDPSRYLFLERTYVDGSGYKVRIFDTTTRGATPVQRVFSLATTPAIPMRKRLLLDFHSLGLPAVFNVEGMTWGPRLPSGERTLVLVTDDNFNPLEQTQVIALAVR